MDDIVIRCKFKLYSVAEIASGPKFRSLKFIADYDNQTPEDQRFYKATPSGQFEMVTDNPHVIENYKVGQSYYFDITPAAAPAK